MPRGKLFGMPQFQGPPRAVLVAISRVSGETYEDVEGAELLAELERVGRKPDSIGLRNLMERLKADSYVTYYAGAGLQTEGVD